MDYPCLLEVMGLKVSFTWEYKHWYFNFRINLNSQIKRSYPIAMPFINAIFNRMDAH